MYNPHKVITPMSLLLPIYTPFPVECLFLVVGPPPHTPQTHRHKLMYAVWWTSKNSKSRCLSPSVEAEEASSFSHCRDVAIGWSCGLSMGMISEVYKRKQVMWVILHEWHLFLEPQDLDQRLLLYYHSASYFLILWTSLSSCLFQVWSYSLPVFCETQRPSNTFPFA